MTGICFFRVLLVMLLFVTSGYCQAPIPSTPAGRTLQAWLDAFNSGDREKVAAYVKTTDKANSVEGGSLRFDSRREGSTCCRSRAAKPLHIRFRVKEKKWTHECIGEPDCEG